MDNVESKKEAISEMAKRMESMAEMSKRELRYQGRILRTASRELSYAHKEIQESEEIVSKWLWCCPWCRKTKEQTIFVEESHLDPEEIEYLWCKRYEPEELWLQHIESTLDRLLLMVDDIEKILEQQTTYAKNMLDKVKKIEKKTSSVASKLKRMHP